MGLKGPLLIVVRVHLAVSKATTSITNRTVRRFSSRILPDLSCLSRFIRMPEVRPINPLQPQRIFFVRNFNTYDFIPCFFNVPSNITVPLNS